MITQAQIDSLKVKLYYELISKPMLEVSENEAELIQQLGKDKAIDMKVHAVIKGVMGE